MAQVTIYLDDKTEARVRTAAKAQGVSRSQWITEAIQARIATEWPAELRACLGTWRDEDFPAAEELRAITADDLPRASF